MLRVNINHKILLRGVGALAVTISRSFCHYPAHPVAPHPISILPCPHFVGKLGDLPPPPSSLPPLPAPFVADVTNSGCPPRPFPASPRLVCHSCDKQYPLPPALPRSICDSCDKRGLRCCHVGTMNRSAYHHYSCIVSLELHAILSEL